jgi:hypothetical protein
MGQSQPLLEDGASEKDLGQEIGRLVTSEFTSDFSKPLEKRLLAALELSKECKRVIWNNAE